MSRVVAISFDADGTLWDFEWTMRHALDCALVELRRLYPEAAGRLTPETLIEHRNRAARELKSQRFTMEQIRLAAFTLTLQQIGVDDDDAAERITNLYLKHRFDNVVMFDDVLPTLDTLGNRFRLGLLSNGNSYPERCGLTNQFQFVVFAHDHGWKKPDLRLFELALGQARCSPSEWLHVGDSLTNDVLGAQQVGARSVWINREGQSNMTDIRPDFEITTLAEVIGICNGVECQ